MIFAGKNFLRKSFFPHPFFKTFLELSVGATTGRPFFMSKDNERSIENPFGGTRVTIGRPFKIYTPPTKQSADTSHDDNSVKQTQTIEAAVLSC